VQCILYDHLIESFFGNLNVLSISSYTDLNAKELALFVPLIISLAIIGIKPHLLLDVFFVDSINILEHAYLGRN
jgi:NADH:ubiquinone oxidoreductase subunit 4 (subunit M)